MKVGIRMLRAGWLLLACSGLLFGGKFWMEKDPGEWSQIELQRVLTDSAWARKTPILIKGDSGTVIGTSSAESSACPAEEAQNEMRNAEIARLRSSSRAALVRWDSSLPVRHALLRAGFLGESPPPEKVRAFLSPVTSHYVLSVTGMPARIIQEAGAELTAMAVLRRKAQDPIYAESSRVDLSSAMTVVQFQFPARPAIEASDKEVEFVLKLPGAEVRQRFVLKRMLFGGGLTL